MKQIHSYLISRILPAVLMLIAPAVPSRAQGKPVMDIPRFIQEAEQWAEEAKKWVELAQYGYDQYNAIAHSNSIKDYIYNSASALVYWSPDFANFVYETEELASLYDNGKSNIQGMLNRGEISLDDASRMLGDLTQAIDASMREAQYITDIVLDYKNTMNNVDRKKAAAAAAQKMLGYRFKLIADQRQQKTKSDTYDVMAGTYDFATSFYAQAKTEMQKEAAKRQAKNLLASMNIGSNSEEADREIAERFDEETGIGKRTRGTDSRIMLGYILIAIIGMAYVPYSIYKYTKGEKQSLDTMLKVFVGLLIGVLLLALFDNFFLNPSSGQKLNLMKLFVK